LKKREFANKRIAKNKEDREEKKNPKADTKKEQDIDIKI
jgi:hypothetical protein